MVLSTPLQSFVRNRRELDKVDRALAAKREEDRRIRIAEMIAQRRETLLGLLGPNPAGLLVWHFGADWESRSVHEVPTPKLEEFVGKYALD
jgi:hypothetical protein